MFAPFEIAKESYSSDRKQNVGGYKYMAESSHERTAVYLNSADKTMVIGLRGTQGAKDWLSNINIITMNQNADPDYLQDEALYSKLKTQYPDYKFVVTGHSRGGDRARNLVHKFRDVKAVTYNAASGPMDLFRKVKCGIMNFFVSTSPCKRVMNVSTAGDPVSLLSKLGLAADQNITIDDKEGQSLIESHGLDNFDQYYQNSSELLSAGNDHLGFDIVETEPLA